MLKFILKCYSCVGISLFLLPWLEHLEALPSVSSPSLEGFVPKMILPPYCYCVYQSFNVCFNSNFSLIVRMYVLVIQLRTGAGGWCSMNCVSLEDSTYAEAGL